MTSNQTLTRNIAGEIVLSENPGVVMKKWREIFMIRQCDIARNLRISSSVISDYESGRRRSPGAIFIRRFIETLIYSDMKNGGGMVKKFSEGLKVDAILDIRDFLSPIPADEIIEAVEGEIIAGEDSQLEDIWGYTVIDSIKAILELSEKDFLGIYGASEDRALIFTKVHFGRSPLIAVKVTHPKPKMIVLHGLSPKKVDKLAVKIATLEKIPLIVSKIRSEDELVKNLRGCVS
ncbi:MAG: transcriptional regulator [Candidatus Altiarchaeota archaeon]|nr:transcriptional regulator [Candidatus Altiarchaeota archaeon]